MGFQHCSDTFLANLALRLRPRSFLAGTWILNMGDATTDLYFVDSGKCQVIAYPDEESLVLATIQRGNYFGEVGLLFDVPRTASVFAAEHTDVFTLSREDLVEVLSFHPEERERFDAHEQEVFQWFKDKSYVDVNGMFGGRLELETNIELIRKVPLFESLSSPIMELISQGLGQIAFEPGERIIEKGTVANEMYIINKGAVVVTGDHDSEVFATLSDGSYFGELSLIFDQARTANVTAVQHSLLFVLFKQTFDKIMERAPEHLANLTKVARERVDADRRRRENDAKKKRQRSNTASSVSKAGSADQTPVATPPTAPRGASSGDDRATSETSNGVPLQPVRRGTEGDDSSVVVVVDPAGESAC